MNIPARYCTGYLGDIGMPPPYGPMDFAAWFEAYVGGHWYTFDARNNVPRIGRVLIARGRDATDVAISNTFGPNTLLSFKVWTDEVQNGAAMGGGDLAFIPVGEGATPTHSMEPEAPGSLGTAR
jgi:transglutaminase-like putative cysteine protease